MSVNVVLWFCFFPERSQRSEISVGEIMMLAEFALVLTKDHLLILAHQGAVEYLLLLLLLLLLFLYF